jgi:hypothetical protein
LNLHRKIIVIGVNMGLTASQNPYFVAAGNPKLSITWEKADEPVEIWERFSTEPPVKFNIRDLAESEVQQRKIEVDLTAGEVYTAALYVQGQHHPNPNNNLDDPPPSDLLFVPAIQDQHRNLIHMADPVSGGGTFLEAFVTTPTDAFVLMQVGTTAPVVIPTQTASDVQLMQIEAPAAHDQVVNGATHDLQCKPLIPGELYSVVIMAVDTDGFWDCKVTSVNTKLRQVDITIKNIHVVNDGDSLTNGEAQFWVTIFESGTAESDTVVRTFTLGNDDFEIIDNQDIPAPASWKVTIGPKKIDPAVNGRVAVHTNGLEYDGIKGTDKAGSDGYDQALIFPFGRGEETTGDTDVIVDANPLGGDDFQYNISFDWSVKYV